MSTSTSYLTTFFGALTGTPGSSCAGGAGSGARHANHQINSPHNAVPIATFGSKGARSARSEGHLPT
jgi:hypothetical protein